MTYFPTLVSSRSRNSNFALKLLTAFLVSVFSLGWVSTVTADTTRSCNTEIFLWATEYQNDEGAWSDTVFGSGIKLDAGSLVFRGTAGGVSHNLARKRASQKAEACINRWWDRDRCMAAHSTSYGDQHGRAGITALMNLSICADLRTKGRPDLVGRRLRGTLYGKINGDRCCFDSNRSCPYNYGIQRTGRISTGGPGGRELWPGVTHYVDCR